MAAKPALIAAGIAGALALGTGVYFANEWRACNGIEEDFLDTAYSIRSGARTDHTLAAIGSAGPTSELRKARDLQLDLFGRQLRRIYERCGLDAGKEAGRKAEDILYAP